MTVFRQFEDLDIWKCGQELTRQVYTLTRERSFARDRALCIQIRRAAVSVGSNIAEGFERGGPVEFRHFLSIAKGSAGEVRSQLHVALDQGYIDQDTFERMHSLCVSTSRQISALMKYLDGRSRDNRNRKK